MSSDRIVNVGSGSVYPVRWRNLSNGAEGQPSVDFTPIFAPKPLIESQESIVDSRLSVIGRRSLIAGCGLQ